MTLKSHRSTIKRLPARGFYDKDTVYAILDTQYLCHIAFFLDGHPQLIPTAYGRDGDHVYFHGSSKSRMLQYLATGADVAVAVTQVDGIVLARSLFHSSMNYRSVVIYGCCEEVIRKEDKMRGLRIVSENIWSGRWDEARLPTDKELKATKVIRMQITDGAAKIRTGPPRDEAEDYALDIWAGVIPVQAVYLDPVADEKLREGTEPPESVTKRV